VEDRYIDKSIMFDLGYTILHGASGRIYYKDESVKGPDHIFEVPDFTTPENAVWLLGELRAWGWWFEISCSGDEGVSARLEKPGSDEIYTCLWAETLPKAVKGVAYLALKEG